MATRAETAPTGGAAAGRNAQRTRERILRAAVAEFGAKGYAGARTAGIAARARVNPQLISYYFGGKRGLLDELHRRSAETEATLVPPGGSFAESVTAYVDATLDHPDWARLMIWQALGDDPDAAEVAGDRSAAQAVKLREALERVRHRQRAGELTTEVEAEVLLLLAYAVAFAPIAMPQIVAGIFQTDPGSADYRRRCLAGLFTLVTADRHPRSDT
jgi:AcrR family transcriptional regulator